MTTPYEPAEPFRTALVIFEAARRIGIDAKDIFFSARLSGGGVGICVGACSIRAGMTDLSPEETNAEWLRAGHWWNTAPQEKCAEVYKDVMSRQNVVEVAAALVQMKRTLDH